MLDALIQAVYNLLSLIGITNPSSSGTDTVMNYLRKLDKKVLMPVQYRAVIPAVTTETNVISVSGKGELRQVICDASTNAGYMKVTIDGSVVFYGSVRASGFAGILKPYGSNTANTITLVSGHGLISGSNSKQIDISTNADPRTFGVNSANTPANNTTNTIVTLEDPIPFNTSLVISAWYTTTAGGARLSADYSVEQ